jgi:hypothetical protein
MRSSCCQCDVSINFFFIFYEVRVVSNEYRRLVLPRTFLVEKSRVPSTAQTSSSYLSFFYYYLVCEAIGAAATPGLLCQPRVIVKMIVEKQIKCRLAGETEVLGENLPQRHFCPTQNPT